MTQKATNKLFILAVIVLLVALPATVLAEEGQGAMAGEAMMAAGKLMVQSTDGHAMEAMLAADGKLLVKGADGQMMEIEVGEDGHMMAGDGTMMAGGYALIENPDVIEPGGVLCVPNAGDAQKLLSETAAMAK